MSSSLTADAAAMESSTIAQKNFIFATNVFQFHQTDFFGNNSASAKRLTFKNVFGR